MNDPDIGIGNRPDLGTVLDRENLQNLIKELDATINKDMRSRVTPPTPSEASQRQSGVPNIFQGRKEIKNMVKESPDLLVNPEIFGKRTIDKLLSQTKAPTTTTDDKKISQPPTPGVGSSTPKGIPTIDPTEFDTRGLRGPGSLVLSPDNQFREMMRQQKQARSIADDITLPPTRTYKQLMDAKTLQDKDFQDYGKLTGSDFTAAIQDFQQAVADANKGLTVDVDADYGFGEEPGSGQDALGGIT